MVVVGLKALSDTLAGAIILWTLTHSTGISVASKAGGRAAQLSGKKKRDLDSDTSSISFLGRS